MILLIVVLLNFAYSQICRPNDINACNLQRMDLPGSPANQFDNRFQDYKIVSMVAVVSGLFLYAVLYILAKGLGLVEFQVYLNAEMLQLGATFIIVLFIVFLVEAYNNAMANFSSVLFQGHSGSAPSLACLAIMHIDYNLCTIRHYYPVLLSEAMNLERSLTRCYLLFGFSFCPGLIDALGLGDNYKLNTRVSQVHMVSMMLTKIQISLGIQHFILHIIDRNALTFALPLGIFLRVFPPTRGIGALLMALALGGYFVFPLAYILAMPLPAAVLPQRSVYERQICYPSFSGATVIFTGLVSNLGSRQSVLDNVVDYIARMRITEWIIPFVAFGITMIFVRYAVMLLGGDTGEIFTVASKIV